MDKQKNMHADFLLLRENTETDSTNRKTIARFKLIFHIDISQVQSTLQRKVANTNQTNANTCADWRNASIVHVFVYNRDTLRTLLVGRGADIWGAYR